MSSPALSPAPAQPSSQPLSQVELILFDMDGTLLDLNFDQVFWLQTMPRHWAAVHGHDPSDALSQIMPRLMAQRGTLNWYSLRHWEREFNIDLEALNHAQRHQIRLLPDTPQVLTALRQAGKRLWLLTNADPLIMAIKLEETHIAPYFEQIITSHEIGLSKEETGFWDQLQQRHPFDASRAIFVDDTPSVLENARHAGLAEIFAMGQPDLTRPAVTHDGFVTLGRLAELLDHLHIGQTVDA